MPGWIKLHRKLVEWEWYQDIPCKTLFIHLLLIANHKPSRWKGISVGVGQVITGRYALSEETGLSEQEIRTALNKLKSTSEITIKPTNKFSLITICKYEDYQEHDVHCQPADQPAGQPTINQQSTTNKNIKNKRKRPVQNEPSLEWEKFWNAYPRKEKKKEAWVAFERLKCGSGMFETIMDKLEEFKQSDQWSREGGRYIPLASSWINGERWHDEIKTPQHKTEKINGITFQ